MKHVTTSLAVASLLAGISGAQGQGLLSIGGGNEEDFDTNFPFSITLTGAYGFDTNTQSSAFDENDSSYYQAGVSAQFAGGDRRTSYNFGALFNATYYADPAPGTDDYYYNARVSFNLKHKVSPRLTISDNAYIAYEFEPDYAVGASTARRSDQYLYGFNNISASYAWTRRFSTVTNYTVSGVEYDDDAFSGENRISQLIAQQFRYALSRVTALTAEYRYGYTAYDNDAGDFMSHYVLAGIDHRFDRRLSGSLRAGAEFREYDNRDGDATEPYVEGSLDYRASRTSNFRGYVRYGLDANEFSAYPEHKSLRTGFSYNQQVAENLSASAGLNYVHSEFAGSEILPDSDDDLVSVNLGLRYQIQRNLALYGDYYFVTTSSDVEFREYDRHRFTLGLSATF